MGRVEITVEPFVFSDDSDEVPSSASSESDTLCRGMRGNGLCWLSRILPADTGCGAEPSVLVSTGPSVAWPLSDGFRQPNQVDQRFFSSDLENGGIRPSSSGVRKLAEPSEEQDEPGVKTGRERRAGPVVSRGVLGAFAKRDAERDLATRGPVVGADGADVVEVVSDLPPRPRASAEANWRIFYLRDAA